jgi:hypothetical protein
MGTTGAMADTTTVGAMVGTDDSNSRATTLVDSNRRVLAMVATTCSMAGSSRGAQPMIGTTGSTTILHSS